MSFLPPSNGNGNRNGTGNGNGVPFYLTLPSSSPSSSSSLSLDRVSSIAAKFIGRPISQLPPIHPPHFSSLELSMASFPSQEIGCPSLDLDLLPASSTSVPTLPYHHPIHLSAVDKSLMTEIATNAMAELLRLSQTNEPFWIKSTNDGRDVLDLETYEQAFPRPNSPFKNPHFRTEATRDSGVVIMNSEALVDMFMDSNKWTELFPTIVSIARTIEVISSGLLGTQNGSLQLMYQELQLLSPLVSTRHFYILRFCQQIEHGTWAVVDVSYNIPRENQIVSHSQCHRLPSGCLIQDMPNGYSKWDVLSDGNPVQEVAHITNGSHPGNAISVLRAFNTSQNNMLILQESCIDSSGSLVVYCPVDLPAMNVVMSGEDPSSIPLLPSGFTILPDGRRDQGEGTSSCLDVHSRSGGSLLTVAFQILVSSLPSGKLNLESVTTVNNLISTTLHQIKTALNCHSS
ncbi:Homeobox-leucine zipper protein HDG11, partial [Cucurbita argyrosperma subsp. sororia]